MLHQVCELWCGVPPSADFLPALINISSAEEKTKEDTCQRRALAGTERQERGGRSGEIHVRPSVSTRPWGVISHLDVAHYPRPTNPPGRGKGPCHLTTQEAFQAVKDFLAIPVPPIPQEGRPPQQDQASESLTVASSRGQSAMRPPQQ